MTNWMPRLEEWRGPRYMAIADALARDVRAGRLRAGDRLPPQRLLADLLGVHLSTVTRAYREAARRGLIAGTSRRGTQVLDKVHAAALFAPQSDEAAGLIDLRTNVPAAHPADIAFDRQVEEVIGREGLSSLMRYRNAGEWRALHAEAAEWLALAGLEPDSFSLALCAGAQHALDLALGVCCRGREVAVEAWTWPGMKTCAAARGLQLSPLAIDGEGVTPDALERAARAGIRVAVLSPSLQNPTGACMGLERRQAIAAVARRHGLWLIEEDVYGLLAPVRLPPLASLLPGQVLYLTSLSKTVAPGLRVGFLALPPALAGQAGPMLHHSAWYLSPMCVLIACRIITSGVAADRLAWQRHELSARNRVLDQALGLDGSRDASCPHRWLPLANDRSATATLAALREQGVAVLNGADLAVGTWPGRPQALRLALGAASDRDALRRAGLAVRRVLGDSL